MRVLRVSVALAVLGSVFAALIVGPELDAYRIAEKRARLRAFEEFLASHPFSKEHERRLEEAETPENPGERYMQEYLLMLDPALGRVPTERLAGANRSARLRRQSALGPSGQPLPSWEERGPNDVGGRTRAIMFDPNDAQHKKVWAGGVAGGLWYTDDITDAAASWHNVNDFWANLAVSSIAYDPTNSMIFYVGTGEGFFNFDALRGAGIFKSTDGGSTWSQLPSTSGATWTQVQDVVVTSAGTILAATRDGDGVQRSTNGGTSWDPVLDAGTGASSSRAADLEIGADGNIYATLGLLSTDGVWKSDDDGQTWTKLNTGTNGFPTHGFERVEIALAPTDANRIYAVTQDSADFGVEGMYRSEDGGTTWQSMELPVDCDGGIGADFTRGQAWYDLILAVKPDDEDVLLAGGIDLFRSDSLGAPGTWSQLSIWSSGCGLPNVHADQHAIAFRPGTTTEAVFGSDGGIYYTADVTQDPPVFVNRNKGYNVTQFYSVAQNPSSGSNLMFGGTQDNGTPQLNAAGLSDQIDDVTGGDGGFSQVNQATGLLAMGSNQYLSWHRSLDGGNTFSYIGGLSSGGSFINPSDLDDDTDHLFFNYSTSLIGRLDNLTGGGSIGATTFGPVGGFGSTVTHVRNSEFSPQGSSTVYVGTAAGRIFRAANAEKPPPGPPVSPDWSELNTTPLPTASVSCIALGAGEDTLLVTLSNYGISSVWYTENGGTSWDNLDAGSNLPDMPVWWALIDPTDAHRVYLGTEAGLWYTNDLTDNPVVWQSDPGIPITRVAMIKYRTSDNQLVLGTHGRGIWTTTLSGPEPTPTPRLVAQVLLEGAYAGSGVMSAPGSFSDALPMKQPYADPFFNGTPNEYDGVDSVLSFPAGTIDWLLVELRTDSTAASMVPDSRRPALLLEDGSVVGLDGDTLRFEGIDVDSYYVVFRHRNHLAAMTASPEDFAAGPVIMDLRTSTSAAFSHGGMPLRNLGDGYYGLFASDANADGFITTLDFSPWIAATTSGLTGYQQTDYNMDGHVTVLDFAKWIANNTLGAASQVLE